MIDTGAVPLCRLRVESIAAELVENKRPGWVGLGRLANGRLPVSDFDGRVADVSQQLLHVLPDQAAARFLA